MNLPYDFLGRVLGKSLSPKSQARLHNKNTKVKTIVRSADLVSEGKYSGDTAMPSEASHHAFARGTGVRQGEKKGNAAAKLSSVIRQLLSRVILTGKGSKDYIDCSLYN
jgi:hypothetical protein